MIDDSADKGERHSAWEASTSEVLGRRVTYLLKRVTDAAGQMANAHLAPRGIDTRHYTVLVIVAANGGSSQQTIANTLGLDRATVVALVDDLEEQGLARRARSREDRRANAVEATVNGRLLARADALIAQCEQALVAALSPR